MRAPQCPVCDQDADERMNILMAHGEVRAWTCMRCDSVITVYRGSLIPPERAIQMKENRLSNNERIRQALESLPENDLTRLKVEAIIARVKDEGSGLCPDCGGPIRVRNPTGHCDHLKYPEYKTPSIRMCRGGD